MTGRKAVARKSVTRQDVARRAGVSGAAVSAVLNGTRGNVGVSEATRERIIQAARELRYRANPSAQALRRQGGHALGMIVQPARRRSYSQTVPSELSFFVREAAGQQGYEIVEVAEYDDDPTSRNPVRLLSNTAVAGLIIIHDRHNVSELSMIMDSGVPAVQVLRPQEGIEASSVIVDPRPGIEAAVDHLIDLGHRRIAYAGPESDHPVDRRRLDAFLEVMADRRLKVPKRLIYLRDYGLETGLAALEQFLTLSRPPTALLTAADIVAFGVLKAAYAHQIRIPDQLSVVSYDDVLADLVAPALTTVTQPLQSVAEHAVATLIAKIDEPSDSKDSTAVSLPSTLHIRESTGPAPVG